LTIQRVFLENYQRCPKKYWGKAEDIPFKEQSGATPFSLGYFERMKGCPNKDKIRIGDYRIGIPIDKENNLIICQRVAHRKDIY